MSIAYVEYNGMAFYGYSLRYYDSYRSDDYIWFNEEVVNRVNNIIKKRTTTVPRGSSLYLAPDCPHAVNDVRRNYKIKRGFDNGDFNVVPTIDESFYCDDCIAIFPVKNVIYRSLWKRVTPDEMLARAREDFSDLKESDMIFVTDRDESPSACKLKAINYPELYLKILLGENKKPVVSYDVLDLDADNELDLDILYLVYKMGIEPITSENYQKFRTELFTLNNYNWRQYPGTISLLNDMMCSGQAQTIRCRPGGEPKPVREIIRTQYKEFADDKDRQLAQDFIVRMMHLENIKFVDWSELYSRIAALNIPEETFSKLFTTITKITPKKFNEETNQTENTIC